MTHPPQNTKIKLYRVGGLEKLSIPYSGDGPHRYLMGLFLLGWLGAWLIAGFSIIDHFLFSGEAHTVDGFWLIAWAVATGKSTISRNRTKRGAVSGRFIIGAMVFATWTRTHPSTR